MYAGKIVEAATALELYRNPRHPYTLGLLKSVPRLDQARKEKLDPIAGLPPDLVRLPPGCSFLPRCRFAVERCAEEMPAAAAGGREPPQRLLGVGARGRSPRRRRRPA